MNNREIRDALASAFFDAELTVRVVNARSTNSIYLTASDGKMPYTIRIANHRSSRHYSTITDYWIDTTAKHLPFRINEAIRSAGERFKRTIPEYVAPVKVDPEVSEKVVQTSDKYSDAPSQNMINLAEFYLNEGGFVVERNAPEKVDKNGQPLFVLPTYETKEQIWELASKDYLHILLIIVVVIAILACLK